MKTVRSGSALLTGVALVSLLAAPALQGQATTTMPSTLRYGSGLMDIPVASVLPHMMITGTYSGFFMKLDHTQLTDPATGNVIGFGPSVNKQYSDASVAMGLFDRVEVGTTLQSFNNKANGGNMWGLFGRLELLNPGSQGLGLAVGARYVTAPDYGNSTDYEPGRLGFPDQRITNTYTGASDVNTKTTLYGVMSAHIRGVDGDVLPPYDLTLAVGYGNGMFKDGKDLGFYNYTSSNGWFFGSAIHFQAGENGILTVMGEYNGFDVNVGTQYDIHGIRLGAQYLAANYGKPAGGYSSEYRRPKFGLLGSVAICPNGDGLLCKPHLMERPKPDTVVIPPPPPDTVRVTREVERPLPTGTPASVCLATGDDVQVLVTAQGDTLVGPSRASLQSMRPGVVFAGTYAGDADWYTGDEAITFERTSYSKTGNEVRMDCAQIMRVGENMGVPLFATRSAERPFQTLYVPVRPGVWQAYQAGLRRTRG
ncbi:MAG: hypothetical protein LJF04_15635 [Gemmatimonadetes bacterium]|nr:hypothetical protein [Gemmatimonadota bacterium]